MPRQLKAKAVTEEQVVMGRPFFPHEADDPDLDWLVSNFLYERPEFIPVETGMLPLILLPFREPANVEAEMDIPPDVDSLVERDTKE